jgi:hypothetical protein
MCAGGEVLMHNMGVKQCDRTIPQLQTKHMILATVSQPTEAVALPAQSGTP